MSPTFADRVRKWLSPETAETHPPAELGATAIDCCGRREVVTVAGEIDVAGINPTTGWFEAHLVDPTGEVRLVWMGRRHIVGIGEGTRLKATGRLAELDGRNAIYNPDYEVIPTSRR